MANKAEVVKPVSKIRIKSFPDGTSTIYRNDGLPTITDKSVSALCWIKSNGFNEADIEVIGDKPDCWETVFAAPEIVEAVSTIA